MQDFQSFPAPAKVNLFLHITGRRDDGYHLLQTVFRLLDFQDTINIRVRQDGVIHRVNEISGVPAEHDLCVRAAKALQAYSQTNLGADISVEKHIPMGGGLGGGSSDAATVLLALNRLWNLKLSRETLISLGLKLGADVPFFIFGENAWAEGVGEKMLPIALKPAWYVVLTPRVHVSTAEIFSSKELTRNTIPTTIAAFSKVMVRNDLEPVVRRNYPAVNACLEWLSQFSQARMSGSGASVFIEVSDQATAEQIRSSVPQEISGVPIFSCVAQGMDIHPLQSFAE